MAKINDTTTYPNTAPALTDHVPGTDVSNTANDANGETVTFTLQGVMDLFEANFAAPATAITSGTFADARIAESNVTQHQAALSITESQISDLGTYLTTLDLGGLSDVTLTTAAQGHILYRNASGWVNLAPGTSGQYLQTQGAGANPVWATGSGGISWSTAVDADIVPDADGTRDLGTTVNRFAELHVDTIDLNGSTITATATKTAPTGDVVGTSDTQTLTNKTITAPVLGGTITGTYTLGGTPTFPATVVSTTGTQTLTNKTLTSPKIAHNYNAQTGTTYTLVAGDQSSVITMSNASANTLTIPPNSSVAFPIGTVIQIWQIGAGTTTIAGGTGVTLSGNGGSGAAYSCDIQTQYGGATITKIATDQWMVAGDIDAVAA